MATIISNAPASLQLLSTQASGHSVGLLAVFLSHQLQPLPLASSPSRITRVSRKVILHVAMSPSLSSQLSPSNARTRSHHPHPSENLVTRRPHSPALGDNTVCDLTRRLAAANKSTNQVSGDSTISDVAVPASPPILSTSLPGRFPSASTSLAAAFFDVDGTIVKSNVVAAFAAYQLHRLPLIQRIVWLPFLLLNIPLYLVLDAIDRSLFNRVFYRSYRGMELADRDAMAAYVYDSYLQPRIFPGVVDYIQQLRSDGFHIVLVTGSPDFLVAPLAHLLGTARVYGARLEEEDGCFTGQLAGAAVSSAEKAAIAVAYAREHGLTLSDCHAYGDSYADREMLRVVGHAFAVKPDRRLATEAEERGWTVVTDWAHQVKTPRK